MNILWGLPEAHLFQEAAEQLGCKLVAWDHDRPLDAVVRQSFALGVFTQEQLATPGMTKVLGRISLTAVLRQSEERVGADLILVESPGFYQDGSPCLHWPVCLPTHQLRRGNSRPEYNCQLLVAEDFDPRVMALLAPLLHNNMNVKIFGRNWPVVQCLGVLDEEEIQDAYFSASCVLVGDPRQALRVLAAGGRPISFSNFRWTGIGVLAEVRATHEPDRLASLIKDLEFEPHQLMALECLQQHTPKARLETLIKTIKGEIS